MCFFLTIILQFRNKLLHVGEKSLAHNVIHRILCTQLYFYCQSVELTQYCKKI